MSGEGVLQRIARGEADAVSECMERYAPLVWSLVRRMRCDAADAEDAVQEVFVDLWKSAGRFDPKIASELTFVATLARRRLIDRARAKGREVPREALFEDSASYEEATLERMETREAAERALGAIERLRPAQREVLKLAVVEGLSHSEIARATGLPLGTVKSHVRRGLERVGGWVAGG